MTPVFGCLLLLLLLAVPARANPLAPNLIATDGTGLYDIYIVPGSSMYEWSWFDIPRCTLPTAGCASVNDMDFDEPFGSGLVVGMSTAPGAPAGVDQGFDLFCTATSPCVPTGHRLDGLEHVEGAWYAVGQAMPPTSALPSLYRLDPGTGQALELRTIPDLLDGQVEGLAWDPRVRWFFTLTCCPVSPLRPGADHIVRFDPAMSTILDPAAPVLDSQFAALNGFSALEWTGESLVAAHGSDLYVLQYRTPVTQPPYMPFWLAVRIGPPSERTIMSFAGIAWTGIPLPIPANRPSWGQLKVRYR